MRMKPNLETLKPEFERTREELGLGVFYGYARSLDVASVVFWDCDGYPDYRLFLEAAVAAGVKIVVFYQRELSSEDLDDALDQLSACELSRETRRDYESRVAALRAREGELGEFELSFDANQRTFVFNLKADWYEELSDIMDELRIAGEDDDDADSLGGYFSKN